MPSASTHAQQTEDLHFRVLKLVQDKPAISQRDVAAQIVALKAETDMTAPDEAVTGSIT